MSCLLAFAILLGVSAYFPAVKASAASSGTCGPNLTWVLDYEGTLTISGTGEMDDWVSPQKAPWASSLSIKKVVVEPGVTTIGYGAFYRCEDLESVYLEEGLQEINGQAFYYCRSLEYVTLPDSLVKLDGSAFFDCMSLTSINIPYKISSIPLS